jgi:hypothetical protein
MVIYPRFLWTLGDLHVFFFFFLTPDLYLPHVDWVRLTRALNGKNLKSDQFTYYIEALKRLSVVLNSLPESIEAIEMISIASDQPFSICVGTEGKI